MVEPRNLTQDELKSILLEVAPVTFKFFISRIEKSISGNPDYADISVNSFLSLICAIMASHDANVFRWMETFYFMQIGEKLDDEMLRSTFTLNLYEQLGIKLQ